MGLCGFAVCSVNTSHSVSYRLPLTTMTTATEHSVAVVCSKWECLLYIRRSVNAFSSIKLVSNFHFVAKYSENIFIDNSIFYKIHWYKIKRPQGSFFHFNWIWVPLSIIRLLIFLPTETKVDYFYYTYIKWNHKMGIRWLCGCSTAPDQNHALSVQLMLVRFCWQCLRRAKRKDSKRNIYKLT